MAEETTRLFKSVETIVADEEFFNGPIIEVLEDDLGNHNVTIARRCSSDFTLEVDEEPCKRIQADHLLSDAVCFVGCSLDAIVDTYLNWVVSCGVDFAIEKNKPFAYVWTVHEGINRQQARDDFLYKCLENCKASNRSRSELIYDAFQDLEVLTAADTNELSNTLRRAANIARLQREAAGKLWSSSNLNSIRAQFETHAANDVLSPFSIASVITMPWICFDGGDSFNRVLFGESTSLTSTRDRLALVASYLSRHAEQTSHWTSRTEDRRRGANKKFHFSKAHFDCRYRAEMKSIIKSTHVDVADMEVNAVVHELRQHFRTALTSATTDSSFSRHVAKIESHRTHLRGKDFGYSCATCLINQWDTLLPCGDHGMCHACLREHAGYCYDTCTVAIQKCYVCDSYFDDWEAQLNPPSLRGSILALDGGGVRGLIQLEILKCIEEEIGVDVPLVRFFDLIVGTSIGGIIALSLGVNQWTIPKCQEQLVDLAQKVFETPDGMTKRLSDWTGGWYPLVYKAAKFVMNSGAYDSSSLENILQDTFGLETELLASRSPGPKVAVTATDASSPMCELLTTYNKSSHKTEQTYRWYGDRGSRRIRVWEAARCTSAAPGYLSEMRLHGQSFLDGGLVFNSPGAILSAEGAKLFNCRPNENYRVSVGCGDMRMMCMSDNVVTRLFKTVMYKTYPAKEEEVRALWGDCSDSYVRLDPKLDIEDISLDDVKSMLSLLSRVRSIIREDKVLQDDISRCAWKLLANTFFCLVSHEFSSEGGEQDVLLTICCRLGKDIRKVAENRPRACLTINRSTCVVDLSELPCTVRLEKATPSTMIDVQLVEGKRKASVNGFPRELRSLDRRSSAKKAQAPIIRKRKFSLSDTTIH